MATAVNMSGTLLMPKATAVWLIENTGLTFKQIATFTDLTEIEVEALADEDIGRGLVGRDPIDHGELTREELDRCEADPNADLKMAKSDLPPVKSRAKGPRYTPVSKRGDKPDAIAYILKHNPEISDAQICKLVGTTKPTIAAIRDRTHANMANLRPRHPAELQLCTYQEYEKSVEKGLKAQGKDPEAVKAERLAEQQRQLEESGSGSEEQQGSGGGFDFSNFMPDAPQEPSALPSSPQEEQAEEKPAETPEVDPESFFKTPEEMAESQSEPEPDQPEADAPEAQEPEAEEPAAEPQDDENPEEEKRDSA